MRKNKISGLSVLLILAFLMLVGNASSYYYDIKHKCENDVCIVGRDGIWEATIWNDGNHNVEFTKAELADTKNNSVFATHERRYLPQSDIRGRLIYVRIGSELKINLTGKIPPANYGKNFIYYPCFTLAIYDDYTIARDDKYEERQCFGDNYTMPVFECKEDANCNYNQKCVNDKCVDLKCGACQYVSYHECEDYECCSNDQCHESQTCSNNTCLSLDCMSNQYFFNHTCYTLDCAQDEFILNRSCERLDCDFDEQAFNHTCKKLNCKESEFISNHTCRPLNCHNDEFAKDHLCLPLNCNYDELIINHTCQKLDCWFFQDITDHKCENNTNVIVKFSLEIIALIVLLTFLLLDFNKFEAMHLKKIKSAKKEPLKKIIEDKKDAKEDSKKDDKVEEKKEEKKENKDELPELK